MRLMNITLIGCGLALGLSLHAQAPKVLSIAADKPGAAIQPTMWGVFFEDINLGADGGVYAEMVKNRSFEFYKPLMGWKVRQQPFREGAVMVVNERTANPANPRYLKVQFPDSVYHSITLSNEGFRGMGVKAGNRYFFSFMYRLPVQAQGALEVRLLDAGGKVLATLNTGKLQVASQWQKVEYTLSATGTEPKASLEISFKGKGSIDIDFISLFPEDTWKGRKGGLRADMIQLLADMKPGFLRFPGGCIVEGHDLNNRYQWKKTVGPVEQRELLINRWNFEFGHRTTPDYFQSFGLGFFEYFQLAEDIGAAPLPILNCGMACQYNTAELVPMADLQPYIQDALDLVEFANGDTGTTWGKLRASMGHPAPFGLRYLGVGNENWGPQYLERMAAFKQAIQQEYPYIQIVGSAGTDPDGDRFDLLNAGLRAMGVEIIDEHYYRRPEWFFSNAARYDNYPAQGAKILAGEYAAQSDRPASPNNKNNWHTALSEAAFMTGLERNAGVVHMASYAPLFAHVDGWQWSPDLIWVDNLKSYGTPNYHVQKLFSLHKGHSVLPISHRGLSLSGADSLYASCVYDSVQKEVVVKLVNAKEVSDTFRLELSGMRISGTVGKAWVIENVQLDWVNSIEQPEKVAPQQKPVVLTARGVSYTAAPRSFQVIRIPVK